jgi:hypothetical protein
MILPPVIFGGFGNEGLELLLAQPLGHDASRLAGLGRGVEEVDGNS